jgi:hypothetical protein
VHQYSEIYFFTHGDGRVVQFGPSDHLQVWRSMGPGKAHELLAAYNYRCFHSPGPGDVFREDDLETALKGAFIVNVVNRAETLEEVERRLERAEQIVGLPWNALFANCQDDLSWIVTGKASSFQRDSLVGVAIGIGLLAFLPTVVDAITRPQRRRRTRR